MSTCLVGRTAEIALRKPGKKPRVVTIAFPSRWSKSTLLDYVRRNHPNETVRILEWHPTRSTGWEPRLWLANPDGFTNYAEGAT